MHLDDDRASERGRSDATPAEDATAEPDDAGGDATDGVPAAFGEPCTVGDDTTCGSGLFCLSGPAGGDIGFCTKTCLKTSGAACAGTPEGTAAFCLVTDVNSSGAPASSDRQYGTVSSSRDPTARRASRHPRDAEEC